MYRIRAFLICILCGISGCGIPPVDTEFVSSVPADTRSFAVAQKAVRACTLKKGEELQRNFRRAGFGVSEQPIETKNGSTVPRMIISSPDDAVSVLIAGNSCYVGLENMTPSQSYQLASIWADAYEAPPNSAYGDGLSDHVSGAWRRFVYEPARIPDHAEYSHRIYIAAYKTWPHGPHDPQRNVGYSIAGTFPKKPGAAVQLTHVVGCNPYISTGPGAVRIVPCTGPDYAAK